jgi:hypothetical protein
MWNPCGIPLEFCAAAKTVAARKFLLVHNQKLYHGGSEAPTEASHMNRPAQK